MALTAESVKLRDPLKGPINAYAKKAQGGLADALGGLKTQARTSQAASGRPQGQYTDEALGRANSMASQGIDNNLASLLGGTSLKDEQSRQDYERQMALAREIGSISKPNTLQEVIAGLSGAAGTAGQGLSLYQALQRPASSPSSYPLQPSGYSDPYSTLDPNNPMNPYPYMTPDPRYYGGR